MELNDYRAQIDAVDQELVRLFQARMDIAGEIAQYKKVRGLPILQPAREREKLTALAAQVPEALQPSVRVLYSLLFELSRTYQAQCGGGHSPLYERILQTIADTPPCFPRQAVVACQGVEGAYAQLACEKLFAHPSIQYFRNFEGVFSAIEAGFCTYGVLPIENSTAGSVHQVYDLMRKHKFHIVRTARLKVDHCLLALPGARPEDVREVFSHEQAISQCAAFLKSLGGVKITPCENTAVAAQKVAQSGRTDAAALSSRHCAALYGLDCIRAAVQDEGNNHTRFLCIAREPEIYPGADRTSLMLTLPHRPGSLYQVLAKLFALGINLVKLESRPIPGRDFEFLFHLDLETSVYSAEFARLLCELDSVCEEFQYLGSYTEVV